jgi:hypothetical protein
MFSLQPPRHIPTLPNRVAAAIQLTTELRSAG